MRTQAQTEKFRTLRDELSENKVEDLALAIFSEFSPEDIRKLGWLIADVDE